jgi:hypothetical protein
MKKMKLLGGLLLYSLIVISQPYGQTKYANSSTLTCGIKVSNLHPGNEGFLMAGMKGTAIHIDKTLTGGTISYTSSPPIFNFERDYTLIEGGGCLNTSAPVSGCIGVNVIETADPLATTAYYAMVGAYQDACFLSLLRFDGGVFATKVYPFPATAYAFNKPVIVQDPGTYEYYIAGAFDSTMYAMKVDVNGVVLWSSFYYAGPTPNSPVFQPRDIIISNLTGDIIVVGHTTPDAMYNRSSDAFFLALDPTNGNVNIFKDYSSTPCQWFNSVKNAACPTGGLGYIVGGHCDGSTSNLGGALMMKLDVNGNPIWNTVLTGGASNVATDEIRSVAERLNTFNNYEYYGLSQMWVGGVTGNMSVFKLDQNGMPAPGMNQTNYYPSGSGAGYQAISMTSKSGGSPNDRGLHLYAALNNNHYFIESYFNGVTGCLETPAFITFTEPGPTDVSPAVTKLWSLTDCNNLSVLTATNTNGQSAICSAGVVAGGNNLRVVSISEENNESASISIFPNPGNGLYTLEAQEKCEVVIHNLAGEKIYENPFDKGSHQLNISNLASGVYFLTLKGDNRSDVVKLIKN